MQPAGAQRLHQRLGDVLLPDDLGERARPVLAVQRQRHDPPPSVPVARPPARGPRYRHGDRQLAPTVRQPRHRGPPCTRQSSLILAAFRPWGGSRGERRTRGFGQLYPSGVGGPRPWVSWRDGGFA